MRKNVDNNAWRFSKKRLVKNYCDVIGPLPLPCCTSGHVQPPLGGHVLLPPPPCLHPSAFSTDNVTFIIQMDQAGSIRGTQKVSRVPLIIDVNMYKDYMGVLLGQRFVSRKRRCPFHGGAPGRCPKV